MATLTTSMIVPLPLNGNYYDINYWNYDNVCPLRGSLTGPVLPAYTLRLDQLSLPIVPLVNGIGDMSNYPYVYTELTSVNAPTVDQAMLSNTPNTNRALFKTATYSDIRELDTINFAFTDGDIQVPPY